MFYPTSLQTETKFVYCPFASSALLTASRKHFWTASDLSAREKIAGGHRKADRGRAQGNHIGHQGRWWSWHAAAKPLPSSGRHRGKGEF